MLFTKMQGAGNDFIILDNRDGAIPPETYAALARRLCARRLSVGADGMMIVVPPTRGGDYKMLFYNSDGSEGEMCGNGARCIARWGYERGLTRGDEQRVETVSGTVIGKRRSERQYTVRLNSPTVLDPARRVTAGGREWTVSYVELGDPGIPHCVVLYPDYPGEGTDALRELGRELRFEKSFPKGANVTFCRLTAPDELEAVTFERGVEDFTLACGTGAGSTAAALTVRGLVSGRDVKISMPGGLLSVTAERAGETWDIFLTGPTNLVAEGEIKDEDLEA